MTFTRYSNCVDCSHYLVQCVLSVVLVLSALFHVKYTVSHVFCRGPNVINSNPGMVMPSQTFNSDNEWLAYAAKMIRAGIDYKQLIDKYVIFT